MSGPGPAGRGPKLTIVPVSFADACSFIVLWHRHHDAPNGHRFSIGVATDDEVLRGVAMVSHPEARHSMDGWTLEVIRTATDGTPNANSCLYGACWRAAKALGYRRLITFTQEGENGASLLGAGYRIIGQRKPRKGWSCRSRPRDDTHPTGVARTLWEAS